jgi:hypothetical protein
MPRPKALAMNDPHTADLPIERIREKLAQRLLGLGNRQTMQVDLRLHPILAATQLTQDGGLHTGPVVDEMIPAGQLWVIRVACQAFDQHGLPVRAAEAGTRLGPSPVRHRNLAARERLDVPDRFPEKPDILFVVGCGSHATSAESRSSIVARP